MVQNQTQSQTSPPMTLCSHYCGRIYPCELQMMTDLINRFIHLYAKYDRRLTPDGDSDCMTHCTMSYSLDENQKIRTFWLVRRFSFFLIRIGCDVVIELCLALVTTLLSCPRMGSAHRIHHTRTIPISSPIRCSRYTQRQDQNHPQHMNLDMDICRTDRHIISIYQSLISAFIHPVFYCLGCKPCVYVLSQSLVTQQWILLLWRTYRSKSNLDGIYCILV